MSDSSIMGKRLHPTYCDCRNAHPMLNKQNKPKLTRTTTITVVKQKFETKIKQQKYRKNCII